MNKPCRFPFENRYGVRGVVTGRHRLVSRPRFVSPADNCTASEGKQDEDATTNAPVHGSYPEKISWARLCKLYELNEKLMDAALQRLLADPLLYRPFRLMRRPGQSAAGGQVLASGQFFSHIAGLGDRNRIRCRVRACNRWLFYVRLCERTVLANTDTEFVHLQMLYAARKFGTLRAALRQYHDRRFKNLPCVMKLI